MYILPGSASPPTFLLSVPNSRPLISPFTNTRLLHLRNSVSRMPLSFSFRKGSNVPPETGCPVPPEQLPINEYQTLSASFPFSWAAGDIVEFCSRLVATGASFALFIGLPVAWFGTVGVESDPLKLSLCAVSSGILFVTIAVLRMYLGWAYVGNRLLSATVEYEETGWYDGQIWVKTAQVLARDRLLGSYTVKPVLNRLKYTLVSLAASLFVSIVVLINIDGGELLGPFFTGKSAANDGGGRVIPGVYSDESARSFEPDAFCGPGEHDLLP
ncbi:uncharacterized protein ycf36 [Cucumis sativus]|uniref:DUF1230 domain-containing protein n=1 Tax=Cucumis sativus TaxID=3659 RepID=A0A0A0L3Z3_CUCSA|nr:uncharacterized protein ycf36 [Cucumis sativus]KGN55327.1 hypothetical protein Csa_012326 [Cucumis sativus]